MPVGAAIGLGVLATGATAYGTSKQNKQNKGESQRVQALVDKYMRDYGDYQGKLQTGGFGDIAGMLQAPRVSTQRGSSRSHSSTTPTLKPEDAGVAAMTKKVYADRLKRGSALPPGYEQQQVRNITEAFEGDAQNEKNFAAKRGYSQPLLNSPATRARAGKIADTRAAIPLMERQMQGEDAAGLNDWLKTFSLGSDTDQYGSSESTTINPADLGAILQYLQMLAPVQPPIVGAPAYTNPLAAGVGSGIDAGTMAYMLGKKK